eukprot:Filipodium_phascolosomae@DN1202_c0_g1_i1.p1
MHPPPRAQSMASLNGPPGSSNIPMMPTQQQPGQPQMPARISPNPTPGPGLPPQYGAPPGANLNMVSNASRLAAAPVTQIGASPTTQTASAAAASIPAGHSSAAARPGSIPPGTVSAAAGNPSAQPYAGFHHQGSAVSLSTQAGHPGAAVTLQGPASATSAPGTSASAYPGTIMSSQAPPGAPSQAGLIRASAASAHTMGPQAMYGQPLGPALSQASPLVAPPQGYQSPNNTYAASTQHGSGAAVQMTAAAQAARQGYPSSARPSHPSIRQQTPTLTHQGSWTAVGAMGAAVGGNVSPIISSGGVLAVQGHGYTSSQQVSTSSSAAATLLPTTNAPTGTTTAAGLIGTKYPGSTTAAAASATKLSGIPNAPRQIATAGVAMAAAGVVAPKTAPAAAAGAAGRTVLSGATPMSSTYATKAYTPSMGGSIPPALQSVAAASAAYVSARPVPVDGKFTFEEWKDLWIQKQPIEIRSEYQTGRAIGSVKTDMTSVVVKLYEQLRTSAAATINLEAAAGSTSAQYSSAGTTIASGAVTSILPAMSPANVTGATTSNETSGSHSAMMEMHKQSGDGAKSASPTAYDDQLVPSSGREVPPLVASATRTYRDLTALIPEDDPIEMSNIGGPPLKPRLLESARQTYRSLGQMLDKGKDSGAKSDSRAIGDSE